MEIKKIFELLQQRLAAVPDVKPKRISGFAIEDYNDYEQAWLPFQGFHHDKQRKLCVALSGNHVFASKALYDESLTDNILVISPSSKEYDHRKVTNDVKYPKWEELLKPSPEYEVKTFPVDAKSIRADLGILLAKQSKMTDAKISKKVKANTTILCRFDNDDEEEYVLFDYYRLIKFLNAIDFLGAEYVHIRCLCPEGNTFSTQICAYTAQGAYVMLPQYGTRAAVYQDCVNDGDKYYYLSLDMAKKIELKPHITAAEMFRRAFPLASVDADELERCIPVFPMVSFSNVTEQYATYGDAATQLSQLLDKSDDIKVDYKLDSHYLFNNAENASGILQCLTFAAKDFDAVKAVILSEEYDFMRNKYDIFRHDRDISSNGNNIDIVDEL